MALGNKIVLTPEPRGRRIEYVISGALLPGTVVQVQGGTARDAGNRLTAEVWNKSGSGKASIIGVLDFDWQQGKLSTEAYVSGKRGFVYFPLAGDELNMILNDVAGTGATSDFAIGDLLMVEDGTGKLIDALTGTASDLSAPFELQEVITDLTAAQLVHVMFTGY